MQPIRLEKNVELCSSVDILGEGNWRAQSKNDPLVFRPFLKVSTCQNSATSEHFQKWPKNQGIVLALSLSIYVLHVHVFLFSCNL